MSMLAGPRRKQKVINLRAKNNAWSNDSSKFGQRMLEKMGWSSGKGLGANENGIVEHVVARYKNDDKGLGFEDKNDQWTKHEDDFNALLANLSNDDSSQIKLHSGISLEVKSKKSKARVHYHKFTRGKDLTRYSEKDLANIFGKKSLKNEIKIDEPIEGEEVKVVKTTEQVFTEKGSMTEYFKKKLASFKNKNVPVFTTNDDEEPDYVFKGFSVNNDEPDDHQGFGFHSFSMTENIVLDIENGTSHIPVEQKCDIEIKKKKKNKKSKEVENIELINDEAEPLKKKKRKNKDCIEIKVIEDREIEAEVKVKKSKKKKKTENQMEEISENKDEIMSTQIEHTEVDNHVPKKKKKRKNKIFDD